MQGVLSAELVSPLLASQKTVDKPMPSVIIE